MQEKLGLSLQNVKFKLKKAKIIFLFALISISSMSCKHKTNINGIDVSVMHSNLLTRMDKIRNDKGIEEVAVKNTSIEVIAASAPTQPAIPTPSLTPEEKELLNYEDYFKFYSYCYIEKNHDRYILYFKKYPETPAIDCMTYVNIGLDNDFYTNMKMVEDPSSPTALVNKYSQLSRDYEPKDLREVGTSGYLLCDVAATAFEEMREAAKEEGSYLKIVSAYRSFDYQDYVYWKPKKLKEFFGIAKKAEDFTKDEKQAYQVWRDRVSARAGSSAHQMGYDADINSVEDSFKNTKEAKWLADNAHKYGFIMRYPEGKEHITGYKYEPWHFHYAGIKIATVMHKINLTYDEFYARYMQKVLLEHPEAAKLSGDEFYDKYLAQYFIKGQVFITQVSMDKDLSKSSNEDLDIINNYKYVSSIIEYEEDDEEQPKESILVLSSK